MVDNTNTLKWLQRWFEKQCNDDWEHENEIHIVNLDNPGWQVKISLENSELESKNFNSFKLDRTEDDWIYCKVTEKTFIGSGGIVNLEEILIVFKKWADGSEEYTPV